MARVVVEEKRRSGGCGVGEMVVGEMVVSWQSLDCCGGFQLAEAFLCFLLLIAAEAPSPQTHFLGEDPLMAVED